MRQWDYPLSIDPASAVPVFLQIARAVADDIRRGRLRPGERLPGTRPLAISLGIHRNTAVAAYAELVAEGWIVTTAAQSTRVSQRLPDPPPRPFATRGTMRRQVPDRVGYALAPAPVPAIDVPSPPGRKRLVFGASAPDLRLLPVDALARAYRRALRTHGRSTLDYGARRVIRGCARPWRRCCRALEGWRQTPMPFSSPVAARWPCI